MVGVGESNTQFTVVSGFNDTGRIKRQLPLYHDIHLSFIYGHMSYGIILALFILRCTLIFDRIFY